MVPKSAVKKNRRDKQKQSRNDEETAGVENKVVWRTLEEIFTLYDGIQAKHQQRRQLCSLWNLSGFGRPISHWLPAN